MDHAGFAWLLLALPIACRETPVLGPDLDDPASASLAASAAPPALAKSSAEPPDPVFIRLTISGFPACPAERAPNGKAKLRSVGDETFGADELRPGFEACLKRSLHEPARVNVLIGILPSGRVCSAQASSTVTLPEKCVACIARQLHEHRFSVADTSSSIIASMRFQPVAPWR